MQFYRFRVFVFSGLSILIYLYSVASACEFCKLCIPSVVFRLLSSVNMPVHQKRAYALSASIRNRIFGIQNKLLVGQSLVKYCQNETD